MLKTLKLIVGIFTGLYAFSFHASAEEYQVTQYRAAPGKLPALLEVISKTNWSLQDTGRPFVMRHSQGNQWDIMLLEKTASCMSEHCASAMKMFNRDVSDLVDFELKFIATSDKSWAELQAIGEGKNFYHIEMFQAGAGKHEGLMRPAHY